jgi:NADH dehydrogenase [ubiquinone] 1 alpha subcomplex assembly factor 3
MSTGKLLDQFNVFQSIESPRSPAIQKCKRDGFVVGNINLRGGLAILNGGVFLWDVQRPEELRREHFSLLELTRPYPEILLVGTGEQMEKLPADVADMLRQRGIQYETMNSVSLISIRNFYVI